MYFHKAQEKPRLYGNFQDRQYSIWRNLEDIYRVDHESEVLIIPGFWGLPPLDYSKYANHGTNHGSTYKNGSLDFDGGDDYAEAVLSDTLTPPLSITLWIKAGSQMSTLIQDDSIANGLLYSRNSVELALYTNTGEKSYAYVLDDTFSQVVLTQLAEAKPLIYVNSQLLSAGALDGTPSPSFSHIRIGGTWDHFNGTIDEVRISNVARTADKIALFHDRPWDLYRPVQRVIYSIPAAGEGRISFYRDLNGLGGLGQQNWNPLG